MKEKSVSTKTWLQWQICSEQNLNPETKSICDLWRKTALSWRNLPQKLIRSWIDQFMKKKSNFSVIFAMTDLPTFLEKYVIRDTEKKHIASISTVFFCYMIDSCLTSWWNFYRLLFYPFYKVIERLGTI